MTALSESFSLTIIHDVFSSPISTFLLFSRVGKPVLDSNYQQDNWSKLLPLAEFTYNNTLSATTGITPFFTNKGYHLNLTIHPEHDLASACACDFVTDLD